MQAGGDISIKYIMTFKVLKNPKLLPAVFLSFFLAFLWLGCVTYWTSSEVHPSLVARHMFTKDSIHYLFSLKPFYNLLLFLSFHISTALNMYPVLFNRILFAFNGAVLSFLLYSTIRKKTDSHNGLIALLVFISSHIFLTRGFRIRSDMLISTLGFLALFLSLKDSEQKSKDSSTVFLILAVFVSMLLVSPKGVYWLFWVGCLLKESFRQKRIKFLTLKRSLLFLFGMALIAFVFQDPFFLKAIESSAGFYKGNLKDVWVFIKDRGFFTPWTELSLFSSFLFKNPQIVFIIFLKTGFVFYRTILSKERKWSLFDTSFVFLLFFFIFHPQPKPFFVCALTPWFLFHFFTDPIYLKLRDKLYSSQFIKGFLIFLFVYGAIALFLKGFVTYKRYNNFRQRKLIAQVSGFFQDFPSLSIYDPHAFLIHLRSRHWFLGPYEAHRLPLTDYIKDHKTDVIFNAAATILSKMLNETTKREEKFINVQSQIYYRSLKVPLSSLNQFSGKLLLKKLEKKVNTSFSEKKRLYWYMFLDKFQRPFVTNKPYGLCLDSLSSSRSLKPRCAYSRKGFIKGLTVPPPPEAKFLVLFYIPPPQGISPLDSVKGLFIYDVFF
ncbi:MAG: hypothetical protein OXB86_02115 [Bdellovibrionales bacterium]|nr:hypothetical protein [Bdellovibrionales bacterium]